ncbi:MAG: response regulator [Candidatus Sericytochromatia bacterium]
MKKILVVEDEVTNQEVAEVILKNQGFQTFLASNGKEGIDKAIHEQPDLILMDILMPVLDGLSAIEILKKDDRTRHIPIVAVTAKASNTDRREAEAAGCDGFLTKPFRNRTLVETVRQFLPDGAEA